MMAADARRADLLTLLAIASTAPPCSQQVTAGLAGRSALRDPTPDEWAAHLMAHALALGRAVDHALDESARDAAARVEAARHLPKLVHGELGSRCALCGDNLGLAGEEVVRSCLGKRST